MGKSYNLLEAKVLATIMIHLKEKVEARAITHGVQMVVTYTLKKAIQKFGDRARASALKEMEQLHERSCFEPICKEDLNPTDRK